jgi:hypothetical protein
MDMDMNTEQRMRPRDAENRRSMSSVTLTLPSLRAPQVRLGALIALGLATFLIGWLMLGGKDKPSAPAQSSVSDVSEAQLREFAASAPNPVYWAGPRTGQTYELFRTSDGRVYVRYLPAGVKVGDPRPQFLTVGTYPVAKAFAAVKRIGRAPGATTRQLPGGGIAVFSSATPSVYFAYPGAKYQVEFFTPSPSSARSLVLGGQVVPIR